MSGYNIIQNLILLKMDFSWLWLVTVTVVNLIKKDVTLTNTSFMHLPQFDRFLSMSIDELISIV